MGRGWLWRWDGRRLWWWPQGRRSANRAWCCRSRERDSPAASPPAPPSHSAAEGPSHRGPGAPRCYPASPRFSQPSGRTGPWGMDLRRTVQTGKISKSLKVLLLPLSCPVLTPGHLRWEWMFIVQMVMNLNPNTSVESYNVLSTVTRKTPPNSFLITQSQLKKLCICLWAWT